MTLEEINRFVEELNKKKESTKGVNLTRIYKKLQKSFKRAKEDNLFDPKKLDNIEMLEDPNNPDSINISKNLTMFIESYKEFILDNQNEN